MLVYGALFLLFALVPVAVGWASIQALTADAPVWRVVLRTWLVAGFCAWVWLLWEPGLPVWLRWVHYKDQPVVAAALLASPAAAAAALLARVRYHYPD